MQTITEKVREQFKKSGVSVRKASAETGIPRPTIANFRDGNSVNSDTLDKLADFLGGTISFPPLAKPAKKPKPPN